MKKILSLLIALIFIGLLSSCTKYTFAVPDQEIEEGSKLEIELKEYASETLKEPLEFAKVSGVGYVYQGKYHYTPDYDSAGEHEVTVLVRDSNKKELKSTFKITVIDVNHAPVGEIKDMRFMEGDIIELNLDEYFEDPDGDEISYELIEGTGKIEERIYKAFEGSALPGIHPVRISVKDNRGNEISEHFVLIVEEKTASPAYDDLKTIFEVIRYEVLKIDLNEQLEVNEKGRFELVDGPGVLSYEGNYYYLPSINDKEEHEVIFRINSNEEDGELKRFHIKVIDKTVGNIIEVGTEEDMYSTIQSAINAAKAGDIVLVHPGTYEETLSITKGIILRGVDRDSVVIKSDKSSNARIYIRQANGFSIENLTIIDAERSVMVSRSTGQIINCKLIGGKTALTYSSGKNDLLIKDSYISTLEEEDVEDLPGDRYYGIYAYGEGRLFLNSNTVKNCGTGIMMTNDLLFKVNDNRFDRNRVGVSLAGDSTGYLISNHVTRNEENGILINSDSIVTLNENKFYSNILHGLDLYLRMCTDCGCGGSVFRGTILGENNIIDDPKGICPLDRDWPENFYTIDETLGK
ncbi:MAG: right-handed parallel beta-helix repeat-containing protein [Thermotogota bacterium]|nr:right-handed parallel beta-helix repeat-containing protein [Thermotogota bacterium]